MCGPWWRAPGREGEDAFQLHSKADRKNRRTMKTLPLTIRLHPADNVVVARLGNVNK
jgi:hypothetical protein